MELREIQIKGIVCDLQDKRVDDLAEVAFTGDYNDLSNKPTDEFATKDYVDAGLAEKQDTLTAGANITIENNVISASGGGSSYPDPQGDDGNYLLQATIDGSTINYEWVEVVIGGEF